MNVRVLAKIHEVFNKISLQTVWVPMNVLALVGVSRTF